MKYIFLAITFFFSLQLWAQAEEISEPLPPKFVFMEFGSTTCLPCIQMEKVLEQLRQEYPQQIKVEFINVGKERKKMREYKIRIIPTQIIYDGEGEEILRHVGYFPFADIIDFLEKQGLERN